MSAPRERPILFSGEMVRAILAGTKSQTRRVVKGLRVRLRHEVASDLPAPFFESVCAAPGSYPARMNPHGAVSISARRDNEKWLGVKPGEFDFECPWADGHAYLRKFPDGRMQWHIQTSGNRLWVRETWAETLAVSPVDEEPIAISNGDRLIEPPTQWTDRDGRKRWRYDGKAVVYRATTAVEFCDGDGFSGDCANREDMPKWRPSIFMPRWASRITLELTGVRVERLQDISEEDARAEGVALPEVRRICPCETGVEEPGPHIATCSWRNPTIDPVGQPYRDEFAILWDSLNAKRGFGWDANPWVWVLSFWRIDSARLDGIRPCETRTDVYREGWP